MDVQFDNKGRFTGRASGEKAVAAAQQLALISMKNSFILRLSLYGFALLVLIAAAILIVFAPAGREMLVTIIAVAFLVISAASAGIATFKFKAPGLALEASEMAESLTKSDEPSAPRKPADDGPMECA